MNFQSIYTTLPNASGWYQQETITAEKGFISDSGILYREHCSSSDDENFLAFCNVSESLNITLENIANTSTLFRRESSFINNSINLNDQIEQGSLQVQASDSRSWRNNSENWFLPNNRNRECQINNEINFRNKEPIIVLTLQVYVL